MTLTGKIEDCISQRLNSNKNDFQKAIANENLEDKEKSKRNFQFSDQMKKLFEQNKIDLTKLNLTYLESQRFKRNLDIIENYDRVADEDQYEDGNYLNELNEVHKLHLKKNRITKRFVNEFKKEVKKSANKISQLRTPTEMEELAGEELDPTDQIDRQPKRRASRRSAPKRKKSNRRRHRYH